MSLSPDGSGVDFAQLTPVAPPAPAPSRDAAIRQAQMLVAAASAEADAIRARAYQEGFSAGREDALGALAPSVEAIHAALDAVRGLEADMADRVEPQAVELAVQVAERVVAGAVEVDPSRVLDVVRGALRTLVERERVSVLVHPDDVEIVRETLPDLEVHDERRVTRGGALLRTTAGEVDATIETKLDRAREALIAGLSSP